jgi:hypothetical protein
MGTKRDGGMTGREYFVMRQAVTGAQSGEVDTRR